MTSITEQTKKATHTLIEPHIIRMKVTENESLEVEDIEAINKIHIKLANGNLYGVLLDTTNYFHITKEARELLATKKFTGSALVVKSVATKLVGNFFIRFNKPLTPNRLFNDEEKALEWLRLKIKEAKEKALTTSSKATI